VDQIDRFFSIGSNCCELFKIGSKKNQLLPFYNWLQ
jgi:hypothetical protein